MTEEELATYRKRTEPGNDWYWNDATDAKDDVAALLDEVERLRTLENKLRESLRHRAVLHDEHREVLEAVAFDTGIEVVWA